MKLKKVGKKIGGATCSPNARDLAPRAQRPDRAPINAVGSLKEEYKAGQKGSGTHCKKLLRIVGAGVLAILMCAGVLCGTLIIPMNSTHANTSAGATTETALAPEAQAKAELDANIINSGSKGLGLDPENDPIVATTDWGLDIKFHNAGEGTWQTSISTNGSVSTAALSGYLYFQGGSYNGVDNLKWIIIGYSTNTASTGPVSGINVKVNPDTTDAGTLIKNYASKGMVYVNSYKSPTYTNAVGTDEIPAGCVLCISEKNLLNGYFNKNTYSKDAGDGYYKGARWVYSDLRTTMSNLCEKDIAGFDTIRDKIQEVELNTYSYRRNVSNGAETIAKDISSDKFFALANSTYGMGDEVLYNTSTYPQNYRLETYLGTYKTHASKRISYNHNTTTVSLWWLRSGRSSYYNNAFIVSASGFVTYYSVDNSYGVRPAFVLKL